MLKWPPFYTCWTLCSSFLSTWTSSELFFCSRTASKTAAFSRETRASEVACNGKEHILQFCCVLGICQVGAKCDFWVKTRFGILVKGSCIWANQVWPRANLIPSKWPKFKNVLAKRDKNSNESRSTTLLLSNFASYCSTLPTLWTRLVFRIPSTVVRGGLPQM